MAPVQLPPVTVSLREQKLRHWDMVESAWRRHMRSLSREQQLSYNGRYAEFPVEQGKAPILATGNKYSPLREVVDEEKYPEPASVVVAPLSVAVPQAPLLGPRRLRRDVMGRRELLRARRALKPVVTRVAVRVVPSQLRSAKLKLKHREVEEATPVETPSEGDPADDDTPAQAPLRPRDPKTEGPGDGIIGFRDRRLLDTTLTWYTFDLLDFIGKWNSGRVSEKLFVRHFGYHFNEREVKVALPSTLVAEMKDWWTNRVRDAAWENYQLSVARSRVLVSELAITAEQQRVANLYAPAIAFCRTWDEQQNVSRVVEGAHVDLRLYSYPKFKRAIQTRFGVASLVGCVSVAVVAVATVVACRARLVAGGSALQRVVRARLSF